MLCDERFSKNLLAAVMGVAVGDAFGFPVQFDTREELKAHPVVDMEDNAVFSDDTSLTLCTLASLIENDWQINEIDMMNKFLAWIQEGYMSAEDYAFDIGRTTRKALQRFYNDAPLELCGCSGSGDCGNGSLMRIAPVIFYLEKNKKADAYTAIKSVSSLTHAHEVCVLGCYIYVMTGLAILNIKEEISKKDIVETSLKNMANEVESKFSPEAVSLYRNIFAVNDLTETSEENIKSTGYVVDSLQAALWAFLTTDSFEQCIIKATSLGDDTDTIAAIAGGLAGIYYGYDAIPKSWIDKIKKKKLIFEVCEE